MSDDKSFMSEAHKKRMWPVLIGVWATFLVYSLLAAPVPGVNEPHYLCKSKHFWQPDWCAGDFFLASPNAHTVFYATIGSLTRVVSLENSALIGRALVYLLLAWGWTQSLAQVFCTRWASLWAAWIYLTLASIGNFSGEWLVGGVEGKVACYGFLFAAFAESLRQRFILAAFLAGLGISFHPVVGVWSMLAYGLSCLVRYFLVSGQQRRALLSMRARSQEKSGSVPDTRLKGTNAAGGIVVGYGLPLLTLVLASLPGLIPVIRLLTESAPSETRYAATYLQVYFRLSHHLDPMLFSIRSYLGYAVLLALWGCSLAWGGRTTAKSRLDGIVAWAVLFALAGILIGWGARPPKLMPFFAERMNLLKFYPFRLADVLLPIAVSVSFVCVLERTLLTGASPEGARGVIWSPRWLLLLLFSIALWHSHSAADQNRYSREDRQDWLDICSWIDSHLPSDALVQSPTNGWAFKWFARRAEYVSFKDCPQDAAGIVEWNRRLNFLQKWFETNYSDEIYSKEELKDLRAKTGITHLLTDRLGPLELNPMYRNRTFQVYDLSSLD